jgi:hypothetical protein
VTKWATVVCAILLSTLVGIYALPSLAQTPRKRQASGQGGLEVTYDPITVCGVPAAPDDPVATTTTSHVTFDVTINLSQYASGSTPAPMVTFVVSLERERGASSLMFPGRRGSSGQWGNAPEPNERYIEKVEKVLSGQATPVCEKGTATPCTQQNMKFMCELQGTRTYRVTLAKNSAPGKARRFGLVLRSESYNFGGVCFLSQPKP